MCQLKKTDDRLFTVSWPTFLSLLFDLIGVFTALALYLVLHVFQINIMGLQHWSTVITSVTSTQLTQLFSHHKWKKAISIQQKFL